MAAFTPHRSTPGRYEVIAYIGRKRERLHTWSRRRDAEENAADILAHGFSNRHATTFDRVEVFDRVNRQPIYINRQPRKRYG